MNQLINDEKTLVTALVSESQAQNTPLMLTPQIVMSQLILAEFRAFRDGEWMRFRGEVDTFRNDMVSRVVRCESSIKVGLDGNGQPSRMKIVEDAIALLNKFRWQALALISAASALFALLGWAFPRNGLIGH